MPNARPTHVVLTNDDGIDAPGLAALETAVRGCGSDIKITVVAPHREHSGCGHQVTNHGTLAVDMEDRRRYRVHGTPADCARLALLELAPDADWLLSGINDGGNLGVDVYMSGTVSAAREATWLGIRSMSISQYSHRGRPRNWQCTSQCTHHVLNQLWADSDQALDTGVFWNVNLPDGELPRAALSIVPTFLEPCHLPIKYLRHPESQAYEFRSDYGGRPQTQGSDVHACFSGNISVTRISASS